MKIVFLCLLACTWFMVGLIWMVQVVHYPMFAMVESQGFSHYMVQHQRLISWVVIGPMVLELFLAGAWAWQHPPAIPNWLPYSGLVLVVVVWASTFLLQVPCHQQLVTERDLGLVARLVQTNWIRTIGWSLHGLLLLVTSAKLMK